MQAMRQGLAQEVINSRQPAESYVLTDVARGMAAGDVICQPCNWGAGELQIAYGPYVHPH